MSSHVQVDVPGQIRDPPEEAGGDGVHDTRDQQADVHDANAHDPPVSSWKSRNSSWGSRSPPADEASRLTRANASLAAIDSVPARRANFSRRSNLAIGF